MIKSAGLLQELLGEENSADNCESAKHLCIIAYDISCPRRLSRVSKTLLDYGLRRQYSLFECHLHNETLEQLWQKLLVLINPHQDRLVAYVIDRQSRSKTLFGGTMQTSEKPLVYDVS